jgi:Probable transposase.
MPTATIVITEDEQRAPEEKVAIYARVSSSDDDYKSLPRKLSNSILINLKQNWKAYFEAKKEYKTHPEKFTAKPKIPRYKPKIDGRNLLIYDLQAIGKKSLKKGIIKPSGLNLEVKTNQKAVDCVRIIPKKTHYVVEVLYTHPIPNPVESLMCWSMSESGPL